MVSPGYTSPDNFPLPSVNRGYLAWRALGMRLFRGSLLMAAESTPWTWKDLVARLRDEPIDTVVQIAASALEDPVSAGLQPMPSNADGRPVFGAVLDEQVGILVQVSGDNYEARLCRLPQPAPSPPPAIAQQAVSSPQRAQPVVRQPTDLSNRSSQSVLTQRADTTPSLVPVLVESRTELVVQRRREQTSLTSFPAERPGETLLMTTLLGTALGYTFGGAKGAMTGALIGGGAGLASIAVSTAATSPGTSLAAQSMFLALASASLGGRGGGPVLRLSPSRQPALPPLFDDDGQPRSRRLPPRKK